MRWLIAILAVALMTASAQAQIAGPTGTEIPGSGIGHNTSQNDAKATDAPKAKSDEKAYNSALRNLPDKQYDPWRGVR